MRSQMAKLTIIHGLAGSGKTRKAREMTKDRNPLFIYGKRIDDDFEFNQLYSGRYDCVVFDDLPIAKIKKVIYLASQELTMVQAPAKIPKQIPTPDFIVTIAEDLVLNIDIIKTNEKQVPNE